jgi:thiosulfate dehydrogenase
MKKEYYIILITISMLFIAAWSANAANRGVADPIRGGKMWDKWWMVNGATTPEGNHPLYPANGQQAGPNTFRCKECHGWDYKGVDGAYSSGSHYTGIIGVWGSTKTPSEMFDLLKFDTAPNGHGYANYGMSD